MGLLCLGGFLLVVGNKKEGPVARDRATEREAELVAQEIRLARLRDGRVGRRHAVPLPEVVGGTRKLVGARLCDHVHKPARRPPEFGRGALIDHNDLLDRVLAEGEGGTLAASLLAEEGVVEVGAVDDEVVEDPPLAVDVEFVAVGSLRDGYTRREQRQVQVVAPVVGQSVHHLLGQPGRTGHVFRLNQALAAPFDRNPFEFGRAEPQRQVDFLADPQHQAGRARRPELDVRPRDHIIGAKREERAHERAGRCGAHGRYESRFAVRHPDDRVSDGGSGRVDDLPANDPGRGLGLTQETGNEQQTVAGRTTKTAQHGQNRWDRSGESGRSAAGLARRVSTAVRSDKETYA